MYFFHHLLLVALESLETTRISVQLGFHYFRSLSWLGRIWMEGVQGERDPPIFLFYFRVASNAIATRTISHGDALTQRISSFLLFRSGHFSLLFCRLPHT